MTGKSCLLLVDIQNDFLPGGALAVGDGDKILPTVYSLVESGEFDLIVASKDYHPEGHVSFASTHGGEVFTPKEVPKLREQGTVTQMLWPDHCVQGTRGSELEAGLQTRLDRLGGDKVKTVHKGRHALVDSYSAFADNQYTAFTALSRILHENGITDVHIVGLATDYCVRATAIDSCKFGFRTTVHAAGVRGVDGGREGEVLEELAGWGCMVV
ncbi:Isochorismatase hydrolase [Exidia glandulosa HHB12029]|uniref:nicotinamidase n=1 Tax=Exidia glandulosa HHB12029 TaxID=1314781 RepID=A0A165QY63_EXIGL|nr:Isochorismatase hydrolase [Exidia glandulosa HHB12029]